MVQLQEKNIFSLITLSYSTGLHINQRDFCYPVKVLEKNTNFADDTEDYQPRIGGHIESSHLRPSKIGDIITAVAEVTKAEGKKVEFKVAAYSEETLLGEGKHLRFIVDKERFMSKLG